MYNHKKNSARIAFFEIKMLPFLWLWEGQPSEFHCERKLLGDVYSLQLEMVFYYLSESAA